jgi:low temperature requirement protein LtrA
MMAAMTTAPPPAEPIAEPTAEPIPDKRVTWAELLFDVVFVFAITQVSALLHEDHSWGGVGRALVVFVPIWWAWVGTTIHANTHDVDTLPDRLGIFAAGLCSLFMALAVTGAYGERGVLFGASYLVLRFVLAALVFRGWRNIPVNSFSVGLLVTGPLLLAGGLVDGPARVALWATAAVVDLVTPRLVRSRLARVRFHPAHLPERFGLFLILALGESVVAIGGAATVEAAGAGRLLAVGTAFAFGCALWWTYFVRAASAMHHAVATAAIQTDVVRPVLAYGHLLFVAGIIAVAVGLGESVAHPLDHLHLDAAALLVGGTALYLATFGYTRWRMFRKVSTTRLAAAAACLPVLPLDLVLPGVVTVLVLLAVVVALNVVEEALISRADGRRRPGRTGGRPGRTSAPVVH